MQLDIVIIFTRYPLYLRFIKKSLPVKPVDKSVGDRLVLGRKMKGLWVSWWVGDASEGGIFHHPTNTTAQMMLAFTAAKKTAALAVSLAFLASG